MSFHNQIANQDLRKSASPLWPSVEVGEININNNTISGTSVDNNLILTPAGTGLVKANGAISLSPTVGIIGTTDGDNVAAGSVGQWVENIVPFESRIALTSGVATTFGGFNTGSNTINWDIEGFVGFYREGAASMSSIGASMTHFVGTSAYFLQNLPVPDNEEETNIVSMVVRFTYGLVSNVAWVLRVSCSFTSDGGTVSAFGGTRIRRIY